MNDYRQQSLGDLVKEPPNLDNPLDVAWLAGLIEGEGHIALQKKRRKPKRRLSVWLTIKMTDRDVVERAAFLFGNLNVGKIKPYKDNNNHLDQWRVQATGKRATIIMQAIFPYMGKRKGEKIKEILEFYDVQKNVKEAHRLIAGAVEIEKEN